MFFDNYLTNILLVLALVHTYRTRDLIKYKLFFALCLGVKKKLEMPS